MFLTKVVKDIKTHNLGSTAFFFFENLATYEIMWKNTARAEQVTNGKIIWRMRIACWIPMATNTHSEYAIPTPFPLQQ
jgi:hypothetical protein